MDSRIKIAALPLDICWGDRDENLCNTEALLRGLCPDTDIVVLPEMFSTGYISDATVAAGMAESADGATMTTVRNWAKRFNVAVAGSYLAVDASKFYNRGFFVEPSGETTFYDKHHLFCLSQESQVYSAGSSQIPVVRFRGWNISMIVCYDLRFPVWCRNVSGRYDLLLVMANWPVARRYAWEHLLIARAIENQAVVVGANRSGKDDYGIYDGLSFVFDPMGKPIGRESESGIIYGEFNLSDLEMIRKRLPVASDADDFELLS